MNCVLYCLFLKTSEAVCGIVVVNLSRYVVTFSPVMDTKEDPQAIIIWDILTGQKKRGFHCESSAHWPIFKSVLHIFPHSQISFTCTSFEVSHLL